MALVTYVNGLHGGGCVGVPGEVHSTQKNPLGLRRKGFTTDGTSVFPGEFIYLKGVASTAVGSWVAYDEACVTALLDTDTATTMSVGIAIATAVVDAATEYGWYQIFGLAEGLCLANFADNGLVYATSTDGSVDDADVTLAIVIGAVGRSARNTTTGTALFQLNYPTMVRAAFD